MLHVSFRILELKKRYPLQISRGTSASSDNLFVSVTDGKHEGIGELAPATGSGWTAERGESQLREFLEQQPLKEAVPHDAWAAMREAQIDPPAMAALDIALWDLLAKQAGLALHRLLGLPRRAVPTSITIGINPPEVIAERVPKVLKESGAKFLKVKLGSPDGPDQDRLNLAAAAKAAAPFGAGLRVDANGGWSLDDAKKMLPWLAKQGVEYVEQPLPEGSEEDLPALYEDRPLPIYIDESCRFSSDAARWSDRVDGVNLKLMKCGGITEALRIVSTARAHELLTMIGCMSESSVGIAAGASLGALFDAIDLDSHLNLGPDPAGGAPIAQGIVLPDERAGHGARLRDDPA